MYNQPDSLRPISSRLTFATKFISPVIVLAIAASFLWPMYRNDAGALPVFGVFIAGIVGYNLWNALRIKKVTADSKNLYVSNYFNETTVPLSEIADVTEIVWLEPRVVTIHLRTPSEFGAKIAFMAPWRFYGGLRAHPIVNQLQAMAALPAYKEVNDSWFS